MCEPVFFGVPKPIFPVGFAFIWMPRGWIDHENIVGLSKLRCYIDVKSSWNEIPGIQMPPRMCQNESF